MKIGVALACALVTAGVFTAGASAGELITVNGHIFRWGGPNSGKAQSVTYAVLQARYAIPSGAHSLSPENCGTMDAFSDIVAASPGLTADRAVSELAAGLAAWESAADLRFIPVDDPHLANIVIGAAGASTGRAFANLAYRRTQNAPPLVKALGEPDREMLSVTQLAEGANRFVEIEQAYVCLSPAVPWKIGFDGNLSVYDLKHTFIHEIGHAIGLDHPGRTGAAMSFRYDERVTGLQPVDIKAVQSLYGVTSERSMAGRTK
jgi:Matrixin